LQVVIQVPNVDPPLKVATVKRGQKLHMRLFNNVATDNGNLGTIVRYSRERTDLMDPTPFLPQAGHRLLQADGMIELNWEGDVWVEGTTGNTVQPQLSFGVE
jgi:hypothetical protein